MVKKTSLSKKYLCIHGHFYQPPRENPWLEMIELQESAFPYHDWNERITRECYGPNTRARILGRDGLILKIINNYEYMSFNFGPTLLAWLEEKYPWIYSQILTADINSRSRCNGHGNAIAQVYNHMIMPLASPRDKLTQIRWGLADFKHRFGRPAEGIWLAETAVDIETLELMAQEGVRFTILSPDQAHSIRPLKKKTLRTVSGELRKSSSWHDVSGGGIDPTRPYRVLLDRTGKKFVDIFFYDGPLSRAIAYEKLLVSGENFFDRINYIFDSHKNVPRLVHMATDGESYGHHFKFGEMALAWLFYNVEQGDEIVLTNYGAFLEMFPPEHEVKIFENSSWSCAHGIGRWKEDCGCSNSRDTSWNQKWRTPLRDGINSLAGEMAIIFEKRSIKLLKDPWAARDDYVRLLINTSEQEYIAFIERHSLKTLSKKQSIEIFQLMESQRMAMYMFTSCGWFFDDISRIEVVQILMYALRGIELIQKWVRKDLEKLLNSYLIHARSNIPEYKNGAYIFETEVKALMIDFSLAAAHHGILSLVDKDENDIPLFSENIRKVAQQGLVSGRFYVLIRDITIIRKRDQAEVNRTYIGLRRGQGNLCCLVGGSSVSGIDQLADEIRQLKGASYKKILDICYANIPKAKIYDLKDLIPDIRKYIIDKQAGRLYLLINKSFKRYERAFHEIINAIRSMGDSLPAVLKDICHIQLVDKVYEYLDLNNSDQVTIKEDILNLVSLSDYISSENQIGEKEIYRVIEEISSTTRFRQIADGFFRHHIESFFISRDIVPLEAIMDFLELCQELNIEPDIWECQNIFYDYSKNRKFMNNLAPHTSSVFRELGEVLGFLIEEQKYA